jgi:hypothetical protein|tara:strand:+ start:394 stop:1185 length:792 start_codon:yes stop_codon:yes gene_type:complete
MAEENQTVTITDAQPETEVLTPEEQDSLKVGEELEAEHEGLLAGKYKNEKELESAYLELQKKLGDQDGVQEGQETQEVTEEPKAEENPAMSLISEASAEYYSNDNSLSAETIEKFSSMSSKDLVNAYVESIKNAPAQQAEQADMTDAQINQVQNSVGGVQQYNQIVSWAGQNLPKTQLDAFDGVVNTGNVEAIKLAVAGLKAQYSEANGFEGTTLQGKPAKASGDVFRSQAELVAAVGDPRYDNDPAYRNDVVEKLNRSDLKF